MCGSRYLKINVTIIIQLLIQIINPKTIILLIESIESFSIIKNFEMFKISQQLKKKKVLKTEEKNHCRLQNKIM